MARHDPVVDREAQLEHLTGETELARHDEQLDRHGERQPRTAQPVHPGGRTYVPGRRGRAGHPPGAAAGPAAQAAEIGADDHQVPAGIAHVQPPPVQRQRLHPKVPLPYFRGGEAHGVPPDHANAGALRPTWPARHGHETDRVHHEPPEKEPDPVPVYIVQRAGGGTGRNETATVNRTAPVAGSDPVRLTGVDLRRSRVRVLNESATYTVRVSKDLADLACGRGALLPAAMGGYLEFATQDDLYAVCTDATHTAALSVIIEYELPAG